MRVTTLDMDVPERARNGALENAILIAGPTASGKSTAALRLAMATGGTVVNTDSMQVYGVLDRLTARPSEADLRLAPHRLYGHVALSVAYSTGAWLDDVRRLIEGGELGRGPAIFVGGTGLYFEALTRGLSQMPAVAEEVRQRWRARLEAEGSQRLHALLSRDDPQVASRLHPSDGQRIVRALEVLDASGRSIAAWQSSRGEPIVDVASARLFVVEPDRGLLAERIGGRLRQMADCGALDEAEAVMRLSLDPSLPAMKAIGLREFADHVRGAIDLSTAIERAASATRQYAKRQATWMRNRFGPEWQRVAQAEAIAVDR